MEAKEKSSVDAPTPAEVVMLELDAAVEASSQTISLIGEKDENGTIKLAEKFRLMRHETIITTPEDVINAAPKLTQQQAVDFLEEQGHKLSEALMQYYEETIRIVVDCWLEDSQ